MASTSAPILLAGSDLARQLACTRIHDLLASHAAAIPHAAAAAEGPLRLTYGELGAQVDALARALIAVGVAPGDRVATLAPPGLDFWLTYLATVSIGAVWMGLNPRYRAPEYAYLLEDAAPRLVFVREAYDGRAYGAELPALAPPGTAFVGLGAVSGAHPEWQAFLGLGAGVGEAALAARRTAIDPEDIAVIVYTSGTTGKPKGAMLSHRAIIAAALANLQWMGDGLQSTICAAPINHVGALNNVCMNVFAYGGRIVFHHRVDLEAIGAIARDERPTFLVAGPTTFAMFAGDPAYGLEALRHYRLLVFGGGATPEAHIAPVAAGGTPMSTVYGQTETCGIVTRSDFGASAAVMAETIGKPLPGAELRIARADGSEAAPGETGEIQVRGPYTMSGYFGRPEATAEAFTADGFLRTGDLGVARPDGNFAFVGRLKEMFKSGGYNVYPVEIEQAIAEHPAVAMSAVLSVPHPMFQEVGHAFVALRPGAALDEGELRAFLRDRLANYKIPKAFEIRGELPLLAKYKIDRQALRRELDARGIK